jgi:TetR/AcrR family transcriptional regulator, transcriptional repressor for nem operon
VSVRSSREETKKRHQDIIDAAARLLREKGVDGVSVPELMGAVGMTHGGFYRHFASKEELVPLAYGEAFDEILERLAKAADEHEGDQVAAWNAIVSSYLSPAHRDSTGGGCAAAALAGDAARLPLDSAAQDAFETGIKRMLDQVGPLHGEPDGTLVALSTLVGALLLSRSTGGELSDAFLSTAREHLLKPERKASKPAACVVPATDAGSASRAAKGDVAA